MSTARANGSGLHEPASRLAGGQNSGATYAFEGKSSRSLIEASEYAMTLDDFRKIAQIMYEGAGITLHENKATLVYSRLAKRLRALGMSSFSDYCALISSGAGEEERQEMLAALTTNVTRFFREPHHFEHLRTKVLPPLIDQARKGGRIRLWSAACSSGQEPYSIAMTVLGLMPDAAQYDVKILATDIDPNILEAGKTGLYDRSATSGVPADLLRRWFKQADNGAQVMRVSAELQALVDFRRLNLIGDWPMRGRFQAIFCRNVVIYFDDITQAKIWTRMVPLLDRTGALYIGHSERVSGAAERVLSSDGITTYRLREEEMYR